jgi:hypothetical protein
MHAVGSPVQIGDIDVRWTKLYKRFAYPVDPSEQDPDCTELIAKAIEMNSKGPTITVELPEVGHAAVNIPQRFVSSPLFCSLKNYDPQQVQAAILKMKERDKQANPLCADSVATIFSQDEDSLIPDNDANVFDDESLSVSSVICYSKCRDAYETNKSRFDECCKVANDAGQQSILQLAEVLDEFLVNTTAILSQRHNPKHQARKDGVFQSIAVPSSKKEKHHGTLHYRHQTMNPYKKLKRSYGMKK